MGSGRETSETDHETSENQRGSGRINAEWQSKPPTGTEWLARLTMQGEYEWKDQLIRQYALDGAPTGNDTEDARRDEREIGALLKGRRLLADSHLLTAAVEWKAKDSDDRQTRLAHGDASVTLAHIKDRRQVAWVQDEWQISDQHLLTPGLRWQQQTNTVTDVAHVRVEQTHAGFEPSVHYLWQLTPAWNLRGSMALSRKPQDARDLSPVIRSSSGTHSSANPDKGGNPGLLPERNRSLELGIEHFLQEKTGTLGLSMFHRQIDQQVQRLVADESGRWVERPYNVGDARLQGGLLDFKWRTEMLGLPQLTLRGNAAYTRTTLSNKVAGLGAGEGPRKSANLGADVDFSAWPLTLGGNFSYTGALDKESSARIRQAQGARRQLDLYALYRLNRQMHVRLSMQNISPSTRENQVQEFDAAGAVSRLEFDREKGYASLFLTLEGKW